MKKIFLIPTLFMFLASVAQPPTPPGMTKINTRYDWLSGKFGSLTTPAGSATPTTYNGPLLKGNIFWDSVGKKLRIFDGTYWHNYPDSVYVLAGDSVLHVRYGTTDVTVGTFHSGGGGGGSSPGGSNQQIQFNNFNAFAGSANLTYDGTYFATGGTQFQIDVATGRIKRYNNVVPSDGNLIVGESSSGFYKTGAITSPWGIVMGYASPNITTRVDTLKVNSKYQNEIIQRNGFVKLATSGNKRFDQYSVIQINGDTLTAIGDKYGASSDDGTAACLVQFWSYNGGITWGNQSTFDSSANPFLIPSLYKVTGGPTDTIKCLYNEYSAGTTTMKQRYSVDGGVSWSSRVTIFTPGFYCSPAPHRVIKLSDGQWAFPYSVNSGNGTSGATGYYYSTLIKSADGGNTWALQSAVRVVSPDSLFDEPGLVEKEGITYIYGRTRHNQVMVARSSDKGAHFDNFSGVANGAIAIGLAAPSATTSIIFDAENNIFLAGHNRIYKATTGQVEDRNYMDISAAYDTILNWQKVYELDYDSSYHFLEPTLYRFRDKIVALYSDGRWDGVSQFYFNLRHRIIPVQRLLPNNFASTQTDRLDIKGVYQWWQTSPFIQARLFKIGLNKFNDSAYYRIDNNENLGYGSFVPKIEIATKGTDRGVIQNIYRDQYLTTEPFFDYHYYNKDTTEPTGGSGVSGNQLIWRHELGASTPLLEQYRDKRMYLYGRFMPGLYAVTDTSGFADIQVGQMIRLSDSLNRLFERTENGWKKILVQGEGGTGGGGGGSQTWQQTLTTGSTLTTNNSVDAGSNYFEFTNLPSLRMKRSGSMQIITGDLSQGTDLKYFTINNASAALTFTAMSDALSGTQDFITLERSTTPAKTTIKTRMRMNSSAPYIEFANTGSTQSGLYQPSNEAYLGFSDGTDGGVTGSAAGDIYFRVNSKKMVWSVDAGSTIAMRLNSSGQLGVGISPTSTLQSGGSFSTKISTTAVDVTLDGTHSTMKVTATGKTVTLPTAVGIDGRIYTVKLTASGTGTVATTSSQTIDGSTTYSLSAQYKYVTVQSDGANWIIIANN